MADNEIIEYRKGRASAKPTFIDGVVFCNAEERATLFSYYEKIEVLSKKIVNDVKSVAELYFLAGEALYTYKLKCPCTKAKINDIANALELKSSTVSKSLRVYYFFADKRDELEGMSMSKALKLIAGKKDEEKKEAVKVSYASDGQREFDFDELFERPTESKLPLSNYRLFAVDSTLWLARKGLSQAINFATIYNEAPSDPSLRVAYDDFLRSVQKDAEQYFMAVETAEKQQGGM